MSVYELGEFDGCPNITGGACDARKKITSWHIMDKRVSLRLVQFRNSNTHQSIMQNKYINSVLFYHWLIIQKYFAKRNILSIFL